MRTARQQRQKKNKSPGVVKTEMLTFLGLYYYVIYFILALAPLNL